MKNTLKLKTMMHAIPILGILCAPLSPMLAVDKPHHEIMLHEQSLNSISNLLDKVKIELQDEEMSGKTHEKNPVKIMDTLKNIGASIPTGDMNNQAYQQQRAVCNETLNDLLHTLGYNLFEAMPTQALLKIQVYADSANSHTPLVNMQFAEVSEKDHVRSVRKMAHENPQLYQTVLNLMVLHALCENPEFYPILLYLALIHAFKDIDADTPTKKNRLVLGGILPDAKIGNDKDSGLCISNTYSEVCHETDLALNLFPESNCHLVGNAWEFSKVLTRFPLLETHKFQSIYFNHIGEGFWADHFTQEERNTLHASSLVEEAVCQKITSLFKPLLSCLEEKGVFVYQSSVDDFLEVFWRSKKLDFLTKDILKGQPTSVSSRKYPSHSEGMMERKERAYSLEGIDNPIIKGYFRSLKEMGLLDIGVEFVLADRCPLSDYGLKTPNINKQAENYKEYQSNPSSFSFDMFLRMRGIKEPSAKDEASGCLIC